MTFTIILKPGGFFKRTPRERALRALCGAAGLATVEAAGLPLTACDATRPGRGISVGDPAYRSGLALCLPLPCLEKDLRLQTQFAQMLVDAGWTLYLVLFEDEDGDDELDLDLPEALAEARGENAAALKAAVEDAAEKEEALALPFARNTVYIDRETVTRMRQADDRERMKLFTEFAGRRAHREFCFAEPRYYEKDRAAYGVYSVTCGVDTVFPSKPPDATVKGRPVREWMVGLMRQQEGAAPVMLPAHVFLDGVNADALEAYDAERFILKLNEKTYARLAKLAKKTNDPDGAD